MKYLIAITFVCMSVMCYSQTDNSDHWNIGFEMGLRCEKGFDNKSQTEKFGATNFIFNVPVSYENGYFVAEFAGQYSGDITASLMGGLSLPLSETITFQLMGGVSDNLYPYLEKPYQLTQKFYGTGLARLQFGTFFIQAQQVGKVSYFGIGLRGGMFEGTYK